jgi:Nucleoporin protein Ndc1-Nup
VFSRAEALRHLLALAVVGAVQVPGFAIIVHGFRISRVVRDRVAPAWIDLQICVVVGAIAGVAFAVAWQASAAYVLRVSPSRVAWRVRVRADLGYAAEPAAVVLGVAAAVAAVLALLMRGDGGEGGDLSVYEIALAATAAVEGAAAVKLDFSWLRRWWICVEAVGLCVLCWTLSSVIVNVLLSQPYDFVLEAKAAAAVPGEQRKAREANGGRRGAKTADPRVLNPLLFALNAAVRYPRADPTGVLGALALQDLCDSVSTSPAGRAPVFADAQGLVWHEILTACLFPIDKLSYRLWLRANSHRSELPALFQAGKMESAALYSGHGFGGADDGGDDVLGAATSWSMDNDDGVLFGDSQRIVHAAGALANLLVASRSPVENEDQYGVAQRTLVDAVTALLQCYVSCRAYNDGQLLQTRSVLSEAHSVPVTAEERDEQYYARLVEDALVRALRQIVTAFHAHIRGYLDAQEPRWSAKFNASLASFLDEVQ